MDPTRSDGTPEDEAAALITEFQLEDGATLEDTLAALGDLPASGIVKATTKCVRLQVRAGGATCFSRTEVAAVLARQFSIHRQRFGIDDVRLAAMTVQQAKNREFDGVVVLWPFQTGGNAEHKRRLLYNAVTRARRWCTVILEGENLLKVPPFAQSL